jgi:hypothetical protein
MDPRPASDVNPEVNDIVPPPPPKSRPVIRQLSQREKCWDLLRRWAGDEDEGLTMPVVLESLKDMMGGEYCDDEWMPGIDAVLNAETDSAAALAALQELRAAALPPSPSPSPRPSPFPHPEVPNRQPRQPRIVPPSMKFLAVWRIPMDPHWVYFSVQRTNGDYASYGAFFDDLRRFLCRIPYIVGRNQGHPSMRLIPHTDWDGCREMVETVHWGRLKPKQWVRVLASGIYQDAVGYVLNLEAAGSTDEHPLVDLLLVPRIQQKLVPTEDKAYLTKTLFARPASLPKYIPHPIPRHLLKKGKWKEIDFNGGSPTDEDTATMSAMPGSEMKLLELGHVRVTKNGLIIRKFNPGKLSPLTKDGKDVFPSGRELRWFILM